jgi:hypothetical protein
VACTTQLDSLRPSAQRPQQIGALEPGSADAGAASAPSAKASSVASSANSDPLPDAGSSSSADSGPSTADSATVSPASSTPEDAAVAMAPSEPIPEASVAPSATESASVSSEPNATPTDCELAAPGSILAHSVSEGDIKIDADFSDWNYGCWVPLNVVGTAAPDDDASELSVRYSEDRLYVALRVTDFNHLGPGPNTALRDIWKFDCLQLAIDNLGKNDQPYEAEFGWAVSSESKILSYRWFPSPGGSPKDTSVAISVGAQETRYEIAISKAALGITGFGPTQKLKLSVVLTDIDEGNTLSDHAELAPGIEGSNKNSKAFPEIVWH